MNNEINPKNSRPSRSTIVKIAYALIFLIFAITAYFWYTKSIYIIPGWYTYIAALMAVISISSHREKPADPAEYEWKSMLRSKKIFWMIVITFWVSVISLVVFFGILRPILANIK